MPVMALATLPWPNARADKETRQSESGNGLSFAERRERNGRHIDALPEAI